MGIIYNFNPNILFMFVKDKLPILGILRGIEKKNLQPLAKTYIESGLDYLEITMNTKGAVDQIRQMIEFSEEKLIIGAGTVLTLDDLEKAIIAGAKFIVCPTIVDEVIHECIKQEIPVFPGALTPNEVYKAWDMGASMVKLFPASVFGPSYIKELKGPFNSLRIIAVGGINEQNIGSYFNSGAEAVAFGGSIFKAEWLAKGRYDLIYEALLALIDGYNKRLPV
jgi:2-dehydro-3-deoxyphosphogluconate aldolase / (4S)-4-hydroxy-2-oxoglutarate aldolase